MIISMDTERVDKIQYSFMIKKNSQQSEYRNNTQQYNQDHI